MFNFVPIGKSASTSSGILTVARAFVFSCPTLKTPPEVLSKNDITVGDREIQSLHDGKVVLDFEFCIIELLGGILGNEAGANIVNVRMYKIYTCHFYFFIRHSQ